jgi:mitochondrial fission protein ELM1
MEKALILTDGKAGHENQSKALARALGLEVEILPVAFKSKVAKALSYLFDRLNIHSSLLFRLGANLPSTEKFRVVIGTGSGVFYAVKVLSKKLAIPSAVVLYPRGYRILGFTCVLSPAFDRPRKSSNVVEIPVNLVSNDEKFYQAGVDQFLSRHTPSRGAVSVIVGGPNKRSSMSAEWIRGELEKVFAENEGKEFWVTTSRRTPSDVEEVIDSFPFDYKLIYSREKFNPIPAFVKLAEKLYVTAESTGMLSEACTFGAAQVEVLDNLNQGKHKFRVFVDMLKDGGYVGSSRKVDMSSLYAKARCLLGL